MGTEREFSECRFISRRVLCLRGDKGRISARRRGPPEHGVEGLTDGGSLPATNEGSSGGSCVSSDTFLLAIRGANTIIKSVE